MNPSKDEARRWFYVREGRRLGPVETTRLVDLVLSGEVSEDALVWHSGLPEWLKAREVEEIRRELPPPVPVVPPPPPPGPVEAPSEASPDAPDAIADPAARLASGEENGGRENATGEGSSQRRRKKRRHRHRDSKRRPAWFWPLIVVLVALMFFLWWLLRRMNEVPPGRIIQTGSHEGSRDRVEPGLGGRSSDAYRVALGREPSVSSRVTSWPPRFTTTETLSPGFFSPSA